VTLLNGDERKILLDTKVGSMNAARAVFLFICLSAWMAGRRKRRAKRQGVVEMRNARDKTLGMPKLIIPSIQVNIRGGRLPEPEPDGKVFLKTPINVL
jgi:hypothetical protein